MKIKDIKKIEDSSEITGAVTESVDFSEGKKAEVKFIFVWDAATREFTQIDRGSITFEGRVIANFNFSSYLRNWILKEHRDNYPEYSRIVANIQEALLNKLYQDYAENVK